LRRCPPAAPFSCPGNGDLVQQALVWPFVQVRELKLSDGPAIGALCDWAWWPVRSEAGLAWLMSRPGGGTIPGPAGWVVERDGEIVASVGNHIQAFSQGDQTFQGATGHSLLVRPDARGLSRNLIKKFVSQTEMFALYTLNANALSAPLYGLFGMKPWEGDAGHRKYVWRVDPVGLMTERLLWKLGEMAGFERLKAGGERFADDSHWNASPQRLASGVAEVPTSQLDERFDRLWARLKSEDRLLAVRDRAALAWRLADPDLTRKPVLLGFEADGELAGYLLAFFSKQTQVDQPALEIIDVIAVRDLQARAVPALITSLVRSARDMGVARVRMSVVNPALEPLVAATPGAHRLDAHPHIHIRYDQSFAETAPQSWYVTPYDGDYSFCLRPPPRPQAGAGRAAA